MNLKVKTKIMIIFAVMLPALIISLGIWVHSWIFQYTLELVIETKLKTDISIASEISAQKKRNSEISDQILLNPLIKSTFAISEYPTALEHYFTYQEMQATLASIIDSDNSIGALLYKSNGIIYRSNDNFSNITSSEPAFFEKCIEKALSGRGQNVVFSDVGNPFAILYTDKQKDKNKKFIYVVREMRSNKNSFSDSGISVIQIDYTNYQKALLRNISSVGEYSCVVLNDGSVLVHSDNDFVIGTKLDDSITSKISATKTGYFFDRLNQNIIIHIYEEREKISVIHVIPTDNINKSLAPLGWFIWLSLITSFVVLILMLWRFSSTLFKPVQQLTIKMKRFGNGERDVRVNNCRNDEIGTLEKQFNHMADDINLYMEQVNIQHQKQTNLELKVLENQINPHFLYNTLDLINWRLRRAGQDEIAGMVTSLAQFFRIGLHGGAEYISLEKEIEHAQLYLSICRTRYGGGFGYKFNVDESLLKCKVKKLILQPILENAIIHGINGVIKNGNITVEIKKDGTDILMLIIDDGRGIQNDILTHLNNILQQSEISTDDSFGLQNINKRISIAYGNEYGIKIESTEGNGTCVIVRIPSSM